VEERQKTVYVDMGQYIF